MKQRTDTPSEKSDLFRRLEKLMREKAVYTNPNLTRRMLADALQTNENYLYLAIKEACDGETVTDYINDHRLEHAKRLLCETTDAKIESIAIDSGFRLRQTFYRLFKKHFGMTPVEYREQMTGRRR